MNTVSLYFIFSCYNCAITIVTSQQLKILTQPSDCVAGEAFRDTVRIAILDEYGDINVDVVTGEVRVSFGSKSNVHAAISPQPNSFPFVHGVATCSGLSIDKSGEMYTLHFRSLHFDLQTISRSFSVSVGPAHALALVYVSTRVYGGAEFRHQPVVSVVDKCGNINQSIETGTIRVKIVVNPTNGHLLPVTNLIAKVHKGQAKFSRLYIDFAGRPYILEFTIDSPLPGGSIVHSLPITVWPGKCAALEILQSPTAAIGGRPFSIQPKIILKDAGGNKVLDEPSDFVRVTIHSRPHKDSLLPLFATTIQVRRGYAVFRNLKIGIAGHNYSLQFELFHQNENASLKSTGIKIISPAFDVAVGPPAKLSIKEIQIRAVLDGQPIHQQPVLELSDDGDNKVKTRITDIVEAFLVTSASVLNVISVNALTAPIARVLNVRFLPLPTVYLPSYGVGTVISMQIRFSDDVLVSGTLTLSLSIPSAIATCSSVHPWSQIVICQYKVAPLDDSTALQYASMQSLQINGGSVVDRIGKIVDLILPALNHQDSLLGSSNPVVIDTTRPQLQSMRCVEPGDGDYGVGEVIKIQVLYSLSVTVYGNPRLNLILDTVGASDAAREANFVSGNNTNMLTFAYIVQYGDAAVRLDVGTTIVLKNADIKRFSMQPTTNAQLTLVDPAHDFFAAVNTISIDTSRPTIDSNIGVTCSNASGIYTPGDILAIQVAFTRPVLIAGSPRLYLETGSRKEAALYQSGNMTKSITFLYTISTDDEHGYTGNMYLNYRDDYALYLNGGRIQRSVLQGEAFTDADVSLLSTTNNHKSLLDNARIQLDTSPAYITIIEVVNWPPGSVVVAGDLVRIEIKFSASIAVDTALGSPKLELAVGQRKRFANYVGKSSPSALSFEYAVHLGDQAVTGLRYYSRRALGLFGSLIKLASSQPSLDCNLLLSTPIVNAPIVDPSTTRVTLIQYFEASAISATYGTNEVFSLNVIYSDEVFVSGVPSIHLNSQGSARYITGSGTKNLKFQYFVQPDDYTMSLNKLNNSAVICDAPKCKIVNANDVLTSNLMDSTDLVPSGIIIDTSPPVVLRVFSPTLAPSVNGHAFVAGDNIEIIVEMSAPVELMSPYTINQTKQAAILVLNTINLGRQVQCQGYYNSDRKRLLFSYTVQSEDFAKDLTYVSADSLKLSDDRSWMRRYSTIPTTDAILTLPMPAVPLGNWQGQILKIDGSQIASVNNVKSSLSDGTYHCGDIIFIEIEFTLNVIVRGKPILWLNVGAQYQSAMYKSGSGSRTLVFAYTIKDGDYSIDLDYVDSHSLDTADAFVQSAIFQYAMIPTSLANLELPFPFMSGSLGSNSNIFVDGRRPHIQSIYFSSPEDVYSYGESISIHIIFTMPIFVDLSQPKSAIYLRLLLQKNSATSAEFRNATYAGMTPNNLGIELVYIPQIGDFTNKLDYSDIDALLLINGARIWTRTKGILISPTQSVETHLNPPRGSLRGTRIRSFVFGMAEYDDLQIDQLGYKYRILFQVQIGQTLLQSFCYVDVERSAVHRVQSMSFDVDDKYGSSVAVHRDKVAVGSPGAKQPQFSVQAIELWADTTSYTNEIQEITTHARQRPAVQMIFSSAALNVNISGWYTLKLGMSGPYTRKLPYDLSPIQIQTILEQDLDFGPSSILVSRRNNNYSGALNGYIWSFTFLYVQGPLETLIVSSFSLHDISATIGDGHGLNRAKVLVESTYLSGFFSLCHGLKTTREIPYDADASQIKDIVDTDLNLALLGVSRSSASAMREYTWSLTFASYAEHYDIDELVVYDAPLKGYGASLQAHTLIDGRGPISGAFRLSFCQDIFPSDITSNIPIDATAYQMKLALEALVSVDEILVERSNSPNAFGGYTWTITFLAVLTKTYYGVTPGISEKVPLIVPITYLSSINGLKTQLLYGTGAHISVRSIGSISLTSPTLLLTHKFGTLGSNSGTASVYIRKYGGWVQDGSSFHGFDTQANDQFGASIGIYKDWVIVGAPQARTFNGSEHLRLVCMASAGYFRLIQGQKLSSAISFDASRSTLAATLALLWDVPESSVVVSDFSHLCNGAEIDIVKAYTGDEALPVVDLTSLQSSFGQGQVTVTRTSSYEAQKQSDSVQTGAVYIFKKSVSGLYEQAARLHLPPEDIGHVQEFGVHVAMYDNFAVVGSPSAFRSEGRVYVYYYNMQLWSLLQTIRAVSGKASDCFGYSFSLSGEESSSRLSLAIGAPGFELNSGAVFVYDLINGMFILRQELSNTLSDHFKVIRFGHSIALDTTTLTLAIGTNGSLLHTAHVAIYTRSDANAMFFTLQQVLHGSVAYFGARLALSRHTLLVSATQVYSEFSSPPVQKIQTNAYATAKYISGGTFYLYYTRSSGLYGHATISRVQTRAIAHSVDARTLRHILQQDLGLGKFLVTRSGNDTSQEYSWLVTFMHNMKPVPLLSVNGSNLRGDFFEPSPTITCVWIITPFIGLRSTVYIFTRDDTGSYVNQATLNPNVEQHVRHFGSALALDSNTAIVGAPDYTHESGLTSGSAFVYDMSFLSFAFAQKAYRVLEGNAIDISVYRCDNAQVTISRACPLQISDFTALEIHYETVEQRVERLYSWNSDDMVSSVQDESQIGFILDPHSDFSFTRMTSQVASANCRYPSPINPTGLSRWIDGKYDYAGVSDYSASTGRLQYKIDETNKSFTVFTADDFVLENPDETVLLRLSLPGVLPSSSGALSATITIEDNGDGGSGAQVFLDILDAGINAQSFSEFGASLSVCGSQDIAIVGAPHEKQKLHGLSIQCGAVYIFILKAGYWEESARIVPSSCTDGMAFGSHVAIDCHYANIRAIVSSLHPAEVSIYKLGGSAWTLESAQEYPAYTGALRVDLWGDAAVVGLPDAEIVYVYHWEPMGWTLAALLRCNDRTTHQILQSVVEPTYKFGHAISISNRFIAIGAPYSDASAFPAQEYFDKTFDKTYFSHGAVYVYSSSSQVQTIALQNDQPLFFGTFRLELSYRMHSAKTVAISCDATEVEMKRAIEDTGIIRSVQVARSGDIVEGFKWKVSFVEIVTPAAIMQAFWYGFGCSECVPFSSTYRASPATQIVVTETSALGDWSFHARLLAPDRNFGDHFGSSLALHGPQLIVGSPGASSLSTTTWDFETGNLTGWLATGTAFDSQPTFRDVSFAQASRSDTLQPDSVQHVNHEGRYWVMTRNSRPELGILTDSTKSCSFPEETQCVSHSNEILGQAEAGALQVAEAKGTLLSRAFIILGQYIRFRIGGGCDMRALYAELLVNGVSRYKTTGRCSERMHRVRWEVKDYINESAQIRIVDASSSDFWGHISFDDVRFSWDQARESNELPLAGAAYVFANIASDGSLCHNASDSCVWQYELRLGSGDKRRLDEFGSTVAIDANTGFAIVSAPGHSQLSQTLNTANTNDSVGCIYVFQKDMRAARWQPNEIARLQYPKHQAFTRFGSAISFDSHTLLSSAPWYSKSPMQPQTGTVFMYDLQFLHIAFTSSVYSSLEGSNDGMAFINVQRMSSIMEIIVIGYATEDDSAQGMDVEIFSSCRQRRSHDCKDYQYTGGQLVFAAGEVQQTIIVPILDNDCRNLNTRYFTVQLFVPGGEAIIGERYTARVRIDDNDFNKTACEDIAMSVQH